jgi:hypothetical protein
MSRRKLVWVWVSVREDYDAYTHPLLQQLEGLAHNLFFLYLCINLSISIFCLKQIV